MSMHPAWLINDIFRLLAEHLTPRDLATLAQTCRALNEPATDLLWHTIRSIDPFLCGLPRNYRSQPLAPSDVECLDRCAARVRVICLEGRDSGHPIRLPYPYHLQGNQRGKQKRVLDNSKPWNAIWEEVTALRPHSTFLPQLRVLRVNHADERLLLALFGLSGSQLQRIDIRILHQRQEPTLVAGFLDSIQDVSKLEHLTVRDGQDVIPSKIIEQAPLKHLRVYPKITGGWHYPMEYRSIALGREILQKESLESLTLCLTSGWHSSDLELGQQKFLANLKSLWLHLTTLNLPAYVTYPASVFFDALDQPRLELLNVKFRYDVSGDQFMDTVHAIARSCKLDNLHELALAGGGWFAHCIECETRPAPLVKPAQLRHAITSLFPLPQLKRLRISVSTNFLDVLDLEMYRAMAEQLQGLEKLELGHWEFTTSSFWNGTIYYERVPLHHIAAFCCRLPNLEEISVGTVDGLLLEEEPRADWACPQIKKASWGWAGRSGDEVGGISRELLRKGVQTYFPHSDMATSTFEGELWLFDDLFVL